MTSRMAKQLVQVIKQVEDEGEESVKEYFDEIIEEGEKPRAICGHQIGQTNGMTPLHAAALYDNANILNMILETGVDINTQLSKDGRIYAVEGRLTHIRQDATALHLAAKKQLDRNVQILLDNGADPNLIDADETVPLHYAAKNYSLVIATLLLEKNANPNAKNKNLLTPMHYATMRKGLQVTMIKLLLDHKASANLEDADGNTPLHMAVARGKLESVKLLVKYTDVNRLNHEGETPMHIACKKDLRETAKVLLGRKPDLQIRDEDEKKALDYASPHLKQVLLEYLASPDDFEEIPFEGDLDEVTEADLERLRNMKFTPEPPKDFDEIRKRAVSLEVNHHELKEKHEVLEADHAALKEDNTKLLQRIDHLEQRQVRLETVIKKIGGTYADALEKTENLESSYSELEDSVNKMDVDGLSKRVNFLESRSSSVADNKDGYDDEEDDEEEDEDEDEDD